MAYWIQVVAGIGFFLSLYSIYVEYRSTKSSTFRPACDINDRISCTKPLKSSYGHMFGVSNSVLGVLFYATVIILSILGMTKIIFYLSIAAILFSLYLAYLLYFKIKSYCLVCTSMYVVNILILILSYFEM